MQAIMHISFQVAFSYIAGICHNCKKYVPIIKQFFIFASGALFTRGLNLLFTPITMQLLSPSDYGMLALANSFISILTAFLGLGLRQALALEYFHLSKEKRLHLICTMISIYLFISVPIIGILIGNLQLINRYLFINQAAWSLLIISLLISFIYFPVELFYQILQYQQQAWFLTKIQSAITIIVIICNLCSLCILRMGACSILIGQLIGMSVTCIIALRLFIQKGGHRYLDVYQALYMMKHYIVLGIPFISSMLCGIILASGDRWVLAHYSTLHNVGIYSIANSLSQLLHMIMFYAMTGSYMPYMLNQFVHNTQDINQLERTNKRCMWTSMFFSFIILSCGFISFKSLLYRLLPTTYHEAIHYMWPLLLGLIFLFGTYFLNCLIQFQKKSLFLGLIVCLPATVNIMLSILLIPYLDLYGCVLATLISYVLYFFATYAYNIRLLRTIESNNIHAAQSIRNQYPKILSRLQALKAEKGLSE